MLTCKPRRVNTWRTIERVHTQTRIVGKRIHTMAGLHGCTRLNNRIVKKRGAVLNGVGIRTHIVHANKRKLGHDIGKNAANFFYFVRITRCHNNSVVCIKWCRRRGCGIIVIISMKTMRKYHSALLIVGVPLVYVQQKLALRARTLHHAIYTNARGKIQKYKTGEKKKRLYALVNVQQCTIKKWWAMRDLNPRPCACKAPALATAPIAQRQFITTCSYFEPQFINEHYSTNHLYS